MVGRHYDIDGERYPSVTTVLRILDKPGLALWRGRVGNLEADRIARESAGIGTAIHRVCERINRGECLTLDGFCSDDELPFATAYLDWYQRHVTSVVAAERLVVSRRYKFAGTADLIAVLDDDECPAVVDLKTSNSDLGLAEFGLQTAAYALALAEEGITCIRRVVVRMPKTEPGKLHVHELPAEKLRTDQAAFRAALALWRWQDEAKPKPPPAMRIRFTRRRR